MEISKQFGTYNFPKNKTVDSQIYYKIHLFQNVSTISYICEVYCYIKIHKYGAPGVHKSRNHENVRLWSLTYENRDFISPKIDQNNSPELLNLLFKHNFHKNSPRNYKKNAWISRPLSPDQ